MAEEMRLDLLMVSEWGQMGVTARQSLEGARIGPPAARE